MVMYGTHPKEWYSVAVAQGIEELIDADEKFSNWSKAFKSGKLKKPQNVIVRKNEWEQKRGDRNNFRDIMKETDAYWILDLHSEAPDLGEYNQISKKMEYGYEVPDDEFLFSKLIGNIGWGWAHNEKYYKMMDDFVETYYDGKRTLVYGPRYEPERLHSGVLATALIWYRAFETSLKLVCNLAEHIQRYDR